jgi:hypothetical protein
MTDNGTPDPSAPDTIVLVHGFWVTPEAGRGGSNVTRTRDTAC